METAHGVIGTGKGLTADKIVSVSEELAVFTGLKIFTAQSKRRPSGKKGIFSRCKNTASPTDVRSVGRLATWGLGDAGQWQPGRDPRSWTQVSTWQTRTLASTSSWGMSGRWALNSLVYQLGAGEPLHPAYACDVAGPGLCCTLAQLTKVRGAEDKHLSRQKGWAWLPACHPIMASILAGIPGVA